MQARKVFSKDLTRAPPTAVEPKQSILKGKVYLGWTKYQHKLFFWDWEKLVNPHMVVFGMSGQGKSTLVKTFLERCKIFHRINAVIIDFSGEYSDYAEHNLQLGSKDFLNIMDLGGLAPRERIEQLMHGFETAFGLNPKDSPLQYILLQEFLEEAYRRKGFDLDKYSENIETPTLLDVYEIAKEKYEQLEKKYKRSEGMKSSIESLMAKIRFYALHGSGAFSRKSTIRLDEITSKGIINLDLSKLPDEKARIFVGMSILEYLIDRMRKEGEYKGIKLVIVLDEAHKLAGENSPLIPLIKEGRKYGFAVVVSTQDVPDVSRKVISNAGSLFIFKLQDYEQAEYIAKSTNMSQHFMNEIFKLNRGWCIAKLNFSEEQSNTFILRVDPIIYRRVKVIFEEPNLKEILMRKIEEAEKLLEEIADKIPEEHRNNAVDLLSRLKSKDKIDFSDFIAINRLIEEFRDIINV